ncbi:molybdate ABC transporter substrate-binding protein [Panacibacter ginsenosidivorans]|uniref:Molybdate ABC transporter substrate-binding protein n=1 Tax=Panacibacter ginsenosidivorans TaxID=1813871 RepID=A0A5B8V9R3_9BACT|nr:molybdate ABC transporter substrate-binding protein [Panacibacter ginsenosidivorans]QEC68072.1 molybdate ABC transporter substrate-binding protein [Panacibacter ginsenosidivorans]
MRKFFFISIMLLALVRVAAQNNKKVTIAVAANMQYAMNALKATFEQQTGIKVEVILGSSGKLTQQILEGAPYDVFISADTSYPQTLHRNKFGTVPPRVYAKGVLVLWTTTPGIVPSKDLKVLLTGNVKKIAIANPKTAPYGVAAEAILKHYNIYDKVKDKLVFGENITQTNQFISSQAADIGFTAKSVVLSDEMKGKGRWIDLDINTYAPIEQAAVILKHGAETNKDASEKFYSYLYSKTAKDIFKQFGYIVN